MGGNLAKGGVEGGATSGLNTGDAMAAANQAQTVNVWTLKLKGEVIGEFVNAAVVPGLTYGWAPAGRGLIAFSNKDGRLAIMDEQGRKQEITASKSALLPAWTDDGKRIAYLEQTGKNKVVLKVVDVTQSQP
jgi:Tol biopolymer transport system component